MMKGIPFVMPLITTSYGATDRGLMREFNEDAFIVDDAARLYAVADGVGGLPNGAIASALAIETLAYLIKENEIHTPNDWELVMNIVNRHVHSRGVALNETYGMGTTLTAAHIRGDCLIFSHVGDTGIFVFRKGKCIQLTRDHTLGQQLKDSVYSSDELIIPEHFLHSLTCCVGQYGNLTVDTGDYTLRSGDRVLIYSDGITCSWTKPQLLDLIPNANDPKTAVDKLIEEANERGGLDNETAILLFVD